MLKLHICSIVNNVTTTNRSFVIMLQACIFCNMCQTCGNTKSISQSVNKISKEVYCFKWCSTLLTFHRNDCYLPVILKTSRSLHFYGHPVWASMHPASSDHTRHTLLCWLFRRDSVNNQYFTFARRSLFLYPSSIYILCIMFFSS